MLIILTVYWFLCRLFGVVVRSASMHFLWFIFFPAFGRCFTRSSPFVETDCEITVSDNCDRMKQLFRESFRRHFQALSMYPTVACRTLNSANTAIFIAYRTRKINVALLHSSRSIRNTQWTTNDLHCRFRSLYSKESCCANCYEKDFGIRFVFNSSGHNWFLLLSNGSRTQWPSYNVVHTISRRWLLQRQVGTWNNRPANCYEKDPVKMWYIQGHDGDFFKGRSTLE